MTQHDGPTTIRGWPRPAGCRRRRHPSASAPAGARWCSRPARSRCALRWGRRGVDADGGEHGEARRRQAAPRRAPPAGALAPTTVQPRRRASASTAATHVAPDPLPRCSAATTRSATSSTPRPTIPTRPRPPRRPDGRSPRTACRPWSPRRTAGPPPPDRAGRTSRGREAGCPAPRVAGRSPSGASATLRQMRPGSSAITWTRSNVTSAEKSASTPARRRGAPRTGRRSP